MWQFALYSIFRQQLKWMRVASREAYCDTNNVCVCVCVWGGGSGLDNCSFGIRMRFIEVKLCTDPRICRKHLTLTTILDKSRDSSVGRALGYRLDDRDSRVRFLAGAGNFSLHHRVRNSSGAHPASYPMGTRGSSLAVKRRGREADHSPPSSAEVKERVELYIHSPNTPSCDARLKHRDNFTFLFF
jgi:hypothetical protein